MNQGSFSVLCINLNYNGIKTMYSKHIWKIYIKRMESLRCQYVRTVLTDN